MWKDVSQPMASERSLLLDEITHIVHGQTTPVFTKSGRVRASLPFHAMSLCHR